MNSSLTANPNPRCTYTTLSTQQVNLSKMDVASLTSSFLLVIQNFRIMVQILNFSIVFLDMGSNFGPNFLPMTTLLSSLRLIKSLFLQN